MACVKRLRGRGRRRCRSNSWSEQLERRVLLAGSISGQLWHDQNSNGIKDAGEPALVGWTVYLDQNRNRQQDAGEVSTSSAADGSYQFGGLTAGTYYVGMDTPLGWQVQTPGASGAMLPAGGAGVSVSGMQAVYPLTYTGSQVPIYVTGEPVDASVAPTDAESSPLIQLNTFRADPRYVGINGSGFSVAILDTGIDLNHPFFGADLDHNGVADRIVYQHDFANNDADASDRDGHGSNVASIAAGSSATYTGMAPGANIIALKVFTNAGSGDFSYIEKALQWCVANAATYNIVAINMSLGDQENWTSAQQLYGLSDEIAALAAQNVIVVSAAGNSYFEFQAQGVSYPAADPNSLAVGAVYDANVGDMSYSSGATDYTTAADRIASFSQRSTSLVDVFAPGAIITGANATGGTAGYTGTSQASPHIAGIAVLAQQLAVQQLGRRLTLAEFKSLLASTGTAIVDGDDENDNVTNTGASFRRVDVKALADAIYAMGSRVPYEYTVNLVDGAAIAGADFGVRYTTLAPAKPVLGSAYDTGVSSTDSITRYDNSSSESVLQFSVDGTTGGPTVRIYANGVLIGEAAGEAGTTLVTTNGSVDLADGMVQITARQYVAAYGESADSPALTLTIDTVAWSSGAGLDTSFGSDGVATFAFPHSGIAMCSVVLPDGRILSVGYSGEVAGEDTTYPLITRSSAGVQDLSFGDSGWLIPDIGYARLTDAALLPDGRVAIVGMRLDGHAVMLVLTAAGAIDTSFGGDGSGIVDLSVVVDPMGLSVGVTADGRILVGAGTGNALSAYRYQASGQLDTSFGTNGRSIVAFPDVVVYRGMAILPDGRIALGGVTLGEDARLHPCVSMLLANGQPDTGFGGAGTVITPLAGEQNIYAVVAQSNGKIVLAGQSYDVDSGLASAFMARYSTDGSLDLAFGDNGIAILSWYPYSDSIRSLAIQPDGRIAVAIRTATQFGIGRVNADGTPDTSFVSGGVQIADMYGTAEDVLLLPGGRLLLSGYVYRGAGQLNGFSLMQYAPTGGPPGLSLLASSDSGVSSADRLTSDTTPTFQMPVVDGEYYRVYRDGVLISPLYASNAQFTAAAQGEGAATYTITIVDAAGNASIASTGLTVTVDTTAPGRPAAPVLAGIANGATAGTVEITLNISAAPYFRVYRDGVQVSGDYAQGALTDGPIPEGTYSYTVCVVDDAGNVSAASDPLVIEAARPLVPTLPASCDSGYSGSDGITNMNNSTGRLLYLTVDGARSGALVRLYVDGVLAGSAIASGSEVEVWLDSSVVLADGQHSISATAQNTGAESPAGGALMITIDTVAPAAASADLREISDSGVSSSDNLTNAASPSFDVSAPMYRMYRDGTLVSGLWASGVFASAALADGNYAFAAAAVDLAGNISATGSPLSVTIDTAAPAVPAAPDLTDASDLGISNTDDITCLSSIDLAMAGALYYRIYDGTSLVSGAWESGSTCHVSGLSDGQHLYTARAVDAAGNISDSSAVLAVTVDTAGPGVAAGSMPAITWRNLGQKFYTFTLHYSDSSRLDADSIDGDEVQVTGPDGLVPVQVVDKVVSINGKTVDVTYSFVPPGGGWSLGDAGTYSVAVVAGSVADEAGNTNEAASVGTIRVTLPSTSDIDIVANGTANADTISITLTGSGYTVSVNGMSYSYAGANVRSITVNGKDGNDRITISGAVYICTVYGGLGNDTITGSSGDDLLRGDEDDDVIDGNAGDDTIYGNFGNDTIAGGEGADAIMAGLGYDSLLGGAGNDSLYAGDQMDTVYGDEGDDYIEGRGKSDTIYGGSGNDTILGGAGSDLIHAEDGEDRIWVGISSVFRDTVDGGGGSDVSDGDDGDVLTDVESVLA